MGGWQWEGVDRCLTSVSHKPPACRHHTDQTAHDISVNCYKCIKALNDLFRSCHCSTQSNDLMVLLFVPNGLKLNSGKF